MSPIPILCCCLWQALDIIDRVVGGPNDVDATGKRGLLAYNNLQRAARLAPSFSCPFHGYCSYAIVIKIGQYSHVPGVLGPRIEMFEKSGNPHL